MKKTFANADYFKVVSRFLAQGQCVRLRVQGESMSPFFPNGSLVSLRPATASQLRRGVPVLARTDEDVYVFHRILHITDDTAVLQGDGNLRGTESARLDQVFGLARCGRLERTAALLWQRMLPVRRYLLGLWRLKRRIFSGASRR